MAEATHEYDIIFAGGLFIPQCLSNPSSPCYSQALTYTFQGGPLLAWLPAVSLQQTLYSES